MANTLRDIARQGLQGAQTDYWFRQEARRLSSAESAMDQMEAAAAQAPTAEQAALRLILAARDACGANPADRLALLTAGLKHMAAGQTSPTTLGVALLNSVPTPALADTLLAQIPATLLQAMVAPLEGTDKVAAVRVGLDFQGSDAALAQRVVSVLNPRSTGRATALHAAATALLPHALPEWQTWYRQARGTVDAALVEVLASGLKWDDDGRMQASIVAAREADSSGHTEGGAWLVEGKPRSDLVLCASPEVRDALAVRVLAQGRLDVRSVAAAAAGLGLADVPLARGLLAEAEKSGDKMRTDWASDMRRLLEAAPELAGIMLSHIGGAPPDSVHNAATLVYEWLEPLRSSPERALEVGRLLASALQRAAVHQVDRLGEPASRILQALVEGPHFHEASALRAVYRGLAELPAEAPPGPDVRVLASMAYMALENFQDPLDQENAARGVLKVLRQVAEVAADRQATSAIDTVLGLLSNSGRIAAGPPRAILATIPVAALANRESSFEPVLARCVESMARRTELPDEALADLLQATLQQAEPLVASAGQPEWAARGALLSHMAKSVEPRLRLPVLRLGLQYWESFKAGEGLPGLALLATRMLGGIEHQTPELYAAALDGIAARAPIVGRPRQGENILLMRDAIVEAFPLQSRKAALHQLLMDLGKETPTEGPGWVGSEALRLMRGSPSDVQVAFFEAVGKRLRARAAADGDTRFVPVLLDRGNVEPRTHAIQQSLEAISRLKDDALLKAVTPSDGNPTGTVDAGTDEVDIAGIVVKRRPNQR